MTGFERLDREPGFHPSEEDLAKMRSRVRFRVAYQVGFYCADLEDLVQETMARFIAAVQARKIQNPDAAGAFLNGICRNVVSEYRRSNRRLEPMPDVVPEPAVKKLAHFEFMELQDAVQQGLEQLSERDRKVLRAFYLEEIPKGEILKKMGLTDDNFRVILCRAKERFRAIYVQQPKHSEDLSH